MPVCRIKGERVGTLGGAGEGLGGGGGGLSRLLGGVVGGEKKNEGVFRVH